MKAKKRLPMLDEKTKNRYETFPCVHNEEVKCRHPGKCQGCGWEPNVAQKRLERFLNRGKKG